MSWKVISGFAFWLAFASIGRADTTISLNPSKDNTLIQASSPSAQLSNGIGDIYVGRTNQDGQGTATISIRRGLLDFDIADSIPAGAIITGGTLSMRDVQGLNGNQTLSLHDVLQAWGEGTSYSNGGTGAAATNGDATWLYTFYNAANPASSPTWTNPGGDFSSTVSASAVDVATGAAGQMVDWSTDGNPQMLEDLQSWLNDPAGNFGWLVQGNESVGQTAKRLDSREDTVSPNLPPELTVDYVLAVPEPSAIWLALAGVLAVGLLGVRRCQRG